MTSLRRSRKSWIFRRLMKREEARTACRTAIDAARAAKVEISYDTNLRLRLWDLAAARRTIDETMALTDIALPSLDESRQLTGVQERDAIVAPASAVEGADASAVVLRFSAGRVERRKVELGDRDANGTFVEIRSGLAAGDTVLANASNGITSGTQARIVAPATAAAPTAR